MSLQAEFEKWIGSLQVPANVKFISDDDGTSVLAFGAREELISISPIIDGDKVAGYFIEAIRDNVSDAVEAWTSNATEGMSDKANFAFAQVLDELVSTAPAELGVSSCGGAEAAKSQYSPAAASNDAEFDFDDDDDDTLAALADEDATQRNERRQKFAKQQAEDQRDEHLVQTLSTSQASVSKQAQQVLMREMKSLCKLKGDGSSGAVEIDLVQDRLDHWRARMPADGFPECPLKHDLAQFATRYGKEPAVVMELMFPTDYPLQPPFIRVIRPRFQMHTGHVTIGGSVCMQALTPSGWLPTFSLENIFVEIRAQMIEGGGRLNMPDAGNDYSEQEAREAFQRVAQRYGWLK